jgi:hypothetical protein
MKRAGDIFSALFDEAMMAKADGYSSFHSCWKDLVEKNGIATAASHTRIKSLEKGLVWIEVDHPGWKQDLQTKESKLLSDFRRRFPELDISGIAIVLSRPGSQPEPQGKNTSVREESPPPYQPAPDVSATGSDDTGYDEIKDPALKDILMRLEQHIKNKG